MWLWFQNGHYGVKVAKQADQDRKRMMRLLPREVDRLLLRQAAELARSRRRAAFYSSEPEARCD